jgi:hypothetical protein
MQILFDVVIIYESIVAKLVHVNIITTFFLEIGLS